MVVWVLFKLVDDDNDDDDDDAGDDDRASQERPEGVQKRPWAALKTLQDPAGELSKRQCCTERLRTRPWIDFRSLLSCCAKTPMCLAHQFLQCFVGFARN